MPEHSRRVHDVRDSETPRLQFRRARSTHTITLGQIEAGDAPPPGIHVMHEQVHHEIARKALSVKALKQERKRPKLHRSKRIAEPAGGKPQIGIKTQAGFKVFSRYKRP